MARSLNRVQLIGNLTRDPELRYTPNGNAVCSFSLATNRSWTTDTGEKREEPEFHRIVSWNKLAEICSQFLTKGRKVYVEGRLSTRSWQGQDGAQRSTTEVVIDDMIILDNRRTESNKAVEEVQPEEQEKPSPQADPPLAEKAVRPAEKEEKKKTKPEARDTDEVVPDDIPF